MSKYCPYIAQGVMNLKNKPPSMIYKHLVNSNYNLMPLRDDGKDQVNHWKCKNPYQWLYFPVYEAFAAAI